MDHPEAFVIWTVRQHLQYGYRVTLACSGRHGNLPGDLDLVALVARGLGDRPLRKTDTRCPQCRAPVLFSVHPPSRHAPGSGTDLTGGTTTPSSPAIAMNSAVETSRSPVSILLMKCWDSPSASEKPRALLPARLRASRITPAIASCVFGNRPISPL